MRVVWTRQAQEDVHEAFSYIALDKQDAAARVVARLEAGERLGQVPYWGRVGKSAKARELAVPGLPYILIYEVTEETVVIERVVHGARHR